MKHKYFSSQTKCDLPGVYNVSQDWNTQCTQCRALQWVFSPSIYLCNDLLLFQTFLPLRPDVEHCSHSGSLTTVLHFLFNLFYQQSINDTNATQVEQFREFSKIYNKMSELCFTQCVWDFGTDQVRSWVQRSAVNPRTGAGQGGSVCHELHRELHESFQGDGGCLYWEPPRRQPWQG